MFYQPQHLLNLNGVKCESGFDFSFPSHLHESFELITVTDGEMLVTVDKIQYILKQGDALLVFPNQVHELHTETHSSHFLCIFSPKLVQAYSKVFLSYLPQSNLFRPDSFYLTKLMTSDISESIISTKGLLYALCSEFDKQATYKEKNIKNDELLSKIFTFVEENYNKDCSLIALSAHTSYHYVYLSKYFKQCVGISFTDYVNRYRINEACYILQNTSQTILKTAYECGFDSLRSFNRNFKSILGITPSEYQSRF